jgi:hypothetical protein
MSGVRHNRLHVHSKAYPAETASSVAGEHSPQVRLPRKYHAALHALDVWVVILISKSPACLPLRFAQQDAGDFASVVQRQGSIGQFCRRRRGELSPVGHRA